MTMAMAMADPGCSCADCLPLQRRRRVRPAGAGCGLGVFYSSSHIRQPQGRGRRCHVPGCGPRGKGAFPPSRKCGQKMLTRLACRSIPLDTMPTRSSLSFLRSAPADSLPSPPRPLSSSPPCRISTGWQTTQSSSTSRCSQRATPTTLQSPPLETRASHSSNPRRCRRRRISH